ncbi:MAG: glycine zipper 2TM domain-containing protein [Dokdonella sp.]|nr:glycine zipper 2TM domain-containing protein [Dokdonella sp.]
MVLAAAALLLAGTQAGAQDRSHDGPDNVKVAWADVLRVDPIYENVSVSSPREICEDVPVTHRVDGGGNNVAGTVVGAIVGGVLGNTVGKGDGRTAATAAGAVVGGAIGNSVARRDDGYYGGVERQCRVVDAPVMERRLVAWDVQYRYRGDVYMSRLDYDPGDRLRVRVSIEPAD